MGAPVLLDPSRWRGFSLGVLAAREMESSWDARLLHAPAYFTPLAGSQAPCELAYIQDLPEVVGVVRSDMRDQRRVRGQRLLVGGLDGLFPVDHDLVELFLTRSSHCAALKLSKVSLLFPSKAGGFSPLKEESE